MRASNFLTFVIALVLTAVLCGQGAGQTKVSASAKTAESRLLVMPADDMKWTDLDPTGAPGVKVADLGSYFMQPGGNYRHITSCDPSSECVFFVESKGSFDLRVVQAGTTAKK